MMYVGNLEDYQGIDLLLESFALAVKNARNNASLVIIGGKQADIQKYQALARSLNIHTRVHFLGPKPVENLADYLAQADILVSPRIKGKNTPMKIYSYLDSGKALLATNLPTHTQVLNDNVALLVDPSPRVFSHGVLRLVEDRYLRQKLGQAAKELVQERHTYTVFQETLNTLYDWIQIDLGLQKTASGSIQTPEAFTAGLRQKKTTPND
ncbi:MAG: glycosyltransferase family 4 protein [Chloroflexi bacterium]|nr:glycosyltransferase family 4 protein [Chloroflexota bacterium]